MRRIPHNRGERREADRVDHERSAVPTTDGGAVERRIGIRRQRSAVGIDMTHLHVGFADDRHLARREEEFVRIGMAHDRWHPRWQTVGRFRVVEIPGVKLALLCRIAWRELRFRRRCSGGPPSTAADGRRLPDAGQVWQLCEGRPVGSSGRLRLRLLCGHADRPCGDEQ